MMNKKLIIVITLFGAIGFIAFGFTLLSDNNQLPSKTTEQDKTNTMQQSSNADSKITEQTITEQNSANYVAYSADKIASDNNTKILFFHAPWCPQCRQLDSDITKNISSDKGVTIYKVDYDSNQDLRKKYGVTLQTTLVKIDSNGNLIKKYVAYQEPTYANVKANLY